jgi:hypothetical protein
VSVADVQLSAQQAQVRVKKLAVQVVFSCMTGCQDCIAYNVSTHSGVRCAVGFTCDPESAYNRSFYKLAVLHW